MPVHIYKRGNLTKKADEGLTFEQQMGTMTSARLAEKFPMLSPYLVGFEVLDKDADGTYGVGTMVYMMGNQAFYIPSFFNHGRLNTGEIMVLRDQQQFLPANEGLISYMKSRYDKGLGTIFPKLHQDVTKGAPGSVKVKKDEFPIKKSASIGEDTINVLEDAIMMGKHASAQLIDIIAADTRMFNEFASYYGLDKIAAFKEAFDKQHAPKKTSVDTWVIDGLDKSAAVMTEDERKTLTTFGFLVKTAKNDFPEVSKIDQVSEQFSTITETGMYEVLDINGETHKAIVVRIDDDCGHCACICEPPKDINSAPDRYIKPKMLMTKSLKFVMIPMEGNKDCKTLYTEAIGRRIGDGKVTYDTIKGIGDKLESKDTLKYDDIIVAPDGSIYQVKTNYVSVGGDSKSFINHDHRDTIRIKDVVKTIAYRNGFVDVPEGSVVLSKPEHKQKPDNMSWDEWDAKQLKEQEKVFTPASIDNMSSAIMNYINSTYTTVKIFSNGSGFTVSGDNNEPKDMSIKEAAFTLTSRYDVDPLDAPHMVLEAYPADGVSNNSVRWCIEKKAAGGDYSRGASPSDIPNLGYHEVSYTGPETETVGRDAVIPSQGASREDILKQVQKAADSGVKEIFDVSLMKVLVKTSRPEALLGDYHRTILKAMDRLCRMLFLGYVKEDDFKQQYGEDKYDEYLETIRNAMEDLSELFIFINTRSVLEDTMDTDGSDDLTDGNI